MNQLEIRSAIQGMNLKDLTDLECLLFAYVFSLMGNQLGDAFVAEYQGRTAKVGSEPEPKPPAPEVKKRRH